MGRLNLTVRKHFRYRKIMGPSIGILICMAILIPTAVAEDWSINSTPQSIPDISSIPNVIPAEWSNVKESELPKQTTLMVAKKFPVLDANGAKIGSITLAKNSGVQVVGKQGDKLEISLGGSRHLIEFQDTTVLFEITEARHRNYELDTEKQKEAAEQRRIQSEKFRAKILAEAAAKRDILILSWRWQESCSQYFEGVGEIMNESDRLLENVQVEMSTEDSSGHIVSTDTALVSDPNLHPGQRTTFRVLVRKKGGEDKARLAFRKLWGKPYTFRIKE